MVKSRDYWRSRFEELEDKRDVRARRYYKELDKVYVQTAAELEKSILHWYSRFALNNNISLDEAKLLLKGDDLNEFKWTVEQYIIAGQENALDQRWMKELENASSRVHISRLESLRLQLQQQVELLSKKRLDTMNALTAEAYTTQYYHTIYEVQTAAQIGFTFQLIDESQVQKVLSKPWTADGMTFSARIWRDRNLLIDTLQRELAQSFVRGEAPHRVISVVQKTMNTSRSNAARLVQTESAFFSAAAQKDAYKELDIEWYEVVATLDSRTSSICQSMDGKVFSMSDYAPGVTANPFHARCRSTTAPYFEDNYGERIARDHEGKTYFVNSKLKYDDWFARYGYNDEKKQKNDPHREAKKEIKRDIKSGAYNLKHNLQHYRKHTIGTNEYNAYIERNAAKGKPKPSHLTISYEEAQEIVNQYAGKGELIFKGENWNKKEAATSNKDIGVHVNPKTGKETVTKSFFIHYSKTGTHIVPTLRSKED